jgi:dTDP-glucose 4,6-dehydratase
MTNKILVTGADGFIGSHLVEALVRQGADVRAFVFYNSLNSWGWLDHLSKEIKKKIDAYEIFDLCSKLYHLSLLTTLVH